MKVFAGFVIAAALLPAQSLPDGKGKDLVESYCSACHGLESVTAQRATKEGWEGIVGYMVTRGMTASNDEVKIIIDYLAGAFPQPPAPPKPAAPPKGKQ